MKDQNKADIFVIIIMVGILVPLSIIHYDLFHSIAEVFATIILIGIFIITWNTRDFHQNQYLMNLGTGFFFIGLLNLIHGLNYNNLIIHGPFIEQWTGMQYFLALVIFIPLLPIMSVKRNVAYLISIYASATILLLMSIYYWGIFPKAYDYELKQLLPFKVSSEFVIIALLLLSLFLLYRRREQFNATIFKYIFFGTLLLAFSEFCFTQYGDTTEFFNALGHLLRVVTFYLFYKAFIQTCLREPMSLIFRNISDTQLLLKDSMKNLEQKIIERTSKIQETNKVLQQKVEEHKLAENKFFNLFESSPQPIIIVDSTGTITLSNRASNVVFGYEEKDLIGQSINILLPDHLKGSHSVQMSEYMESPRIRTMGTGMELVARRRNGALFPVEVSLSPWQEGSNLYVTAVVNDITERKLGEDILRRKNIDLEKKNKELDDFIYNISHEIKAPVSTMMGLTEVYRYELKDDAALDFIEHMDRAIKRLDDYIHNIITFADTAKPTLFPDQIDFKNIVENMFDFCRQREAIQKPIKTMLVVKGDTPFKTDKGRLKIILEHLITNAFQYHSPERKESYVKVCIDKTTPHIKVTVEDNGMGIDDRFLDKIFNMYFRGNYTSKGSGLGLYIAKEAIEKLGGKITVNSTIYEGTSFHFEIPNLE